MTTPALLLPTNELVCVHWLKTIPGIPADRVATTLPGDSAAWADTGFITVEMAGGAQDMYVPQHKPVLMVTCWAANPNSQKPPWGKANQLAEIIKDACQPYRQREMFGVVHTPDAYCDVRVQTAHVETDPRRVTERGALQADEARMALYALEVQLFWVVAP